MHYKIYIILYILWSHTIGLFEEEKFSLLFPVKFFCLSLWFFTCFQSFLIWLYLFVHLSSYLSEFIVLIALAYDSLRLNAVFHLALSGGFYQILCMYVGSHTLCSVWLLCWSTVSLSFIVFTSQSICPNELVPLPGLSINVSESVHY